MREELYQQLLQRESEWLEQEGWMDERRWIEEGIDLQRQLINECPGEVRHKTQLAKLLLQHGRNEKIKYGNRTKALPLFQEALEMNPEDPYPHYHIGYIHFLDNRWEEAVDHFTVFLRRPRLPVVYRVRALCASAISHHMLGNEEKARCLLEEASSADKEGIHSTEIKLALIHLERPVHHYPFMLINSEGEKRSISREEAEILSEEVGTDGFLLDLRAHRMELTGPRDTIRLSETRARLLECLWTAQKALTNEQIAEKVWGERDKFRVVKTTISRLRQQISRCLKEPADHVIQHDGNGYRWNSASPWKIITLFPPHSRWV